MATAGFAESMVALLLLLAGGGLVGGESGGWGNVVPLPADPVVAQIAPAECLFYSSWTGKTQASPDATSSTEQLFADGKFVDYLAHVDKRLRQGVTQGLAAQGVREEQIEGAFQLLGHLHAHAGAGYISEVHPRRNQPPQVFGGLVVRVDDDDLQRIVAALDTLLQIVPEPWRSTSKVGDDPFSRIDAENGAPPISWGIKENYLIVAIGEGEAERIVARLHGSVPAWLSEAKQRVVIPRPASFAHLDIQRLYATVNEFLEPREAGMFAGLLEAFGFDALESLSYRVGLDDRGTVSRGLLKLSGELSGMMVLLDCEPLVAADFQRISSTSPFALVFQLDLAEALTACFDSLEHERAPEDAAGLARQIRLQLEMLRHALGIDILNDLLASIGDTWRVFAQPGPESFTQGWTLAVDLVDSAKFLKCHDRILTNLRRQLDDSGTVEIVSEAYAQTTVHSAHVDAIPIVPAWCIYEDRLLIATSIASVDRLLSSPAAEETLAAIDPVRPLLMDGQRTFELLRIDTATVMELAVPMIAQQLDSLPAGAQIDASLLPPLEVLKKYLQPTVVAVQRTAAGVEITHHATLPSANLGSAVPLLVAATMPAVGGARAAARLNESRNHQKQIALAMHNFASSFGALPAGYSADDEGKPLLSWRVHILPFIEAQGLYEQFHLDEPWDSPHNKKLIGQMPDVYRSPRSDAEQGKTTYLGVGGADGVFVRPQAGSNSGIGFGEITDGTSNTVMTVESSDDRAIVWTRPGDFAPQQENPQQGLRVDPQQGISLGFADGSVLSVPKNIANETLNAFFTKSGGEIVERP